MQEFAAVLEQGSRAGICNPSDDCEDDRSEAESDRQFLLDRHVKRHSPPPQFPAAIQTTCRMSRRSEEHTSELQSLMRISYAVFCWKKKTNIHKKHILSVAHPNTTYYI